MTALAEVRHLSAGIQRDIQAVYDFLAVPANFNLWASGLGNSLRQENGQWRADGPEGPVTIRFSPRNAYGVADHWVTVAPGVEIYIPLRVIANGDGSEVVLTLLRLPEMTAEKFAEDAEWVMRDLEALQRILEK